MKLYLVGHGFDVYARDKKSFVQIPIPAGMSVTFYCAPGALFDSDWEGPIVKGAAGAKDCPIEKAKKDWMVTPCLATCDEHLLTRPGNMRPFKPLEAMKKIAPDAAGTQVAIEACGDGDTLYIDDEDHCTCRLSAILAALEKQGFKGEVHWLACRAPYPDFVSNQDEQDLVAECNEQARKPIDVIKKQPVLPPKPKQQPPPASALDYAGGFPRDYPSVSGGRK
jgi:putative adhesin Stv-like protein